MKNRNRHGKYSHLDREYKTAAARRAHRDAESELISRFEAPVIEMGVVDLRQAEIESLRAKIAVAKSAVNRGIWEQRITELEAGRC
jgi:hypothetical protein